MDETCWTDFFQGANVGGGDRGKGENNRQVPEQAIVLHGLSTWEEDQIRRLGERNSAM